MGMSNLAANCHPDNPTMASLHRSTTKFTDGPMNPVGMAASITMDLTTSGVGTVTHGAIRTTTKRVLTSVAGETVEADRIGTTTTVTTTTREDNTTEVTVIIKVVTTTKDPTPVVITMAPVLDIQEDHRTVRDMGIGMVKATTTTQVTELVDMVVATGVRDAAITTGKHRIPAYGTKKSHHPQSKSLAL